MIEFTTGVAFLMTSMYGTGATGVATASQAPATNAVSTGKVETLVLQDRKAVEKYLREQYSDTPILLEIARCESELRQFNSNGNVLRGRVDRDDIGVMQINERYHADTAKVLGYNIHTIEGNVSYAKYLYEKEGAKPWKASQKCWIKA